MCHQINGVFRTSIHRFSTLAPSFLLFASILFIPSPVSHLYKHLVGSSLSLSQIQIKPDNSNRTRFLYISIEDDGKKTTFWLRCNQVFFQSLIRCRRCRWRRVAERKIVPWGLPFLALLLSLMTTPERRCCFLAAHPQHPQTNRFGGEQPATPPSPPSAPAGAPLDAMWVTLPPRRICSPASLSSSSDILGTREKI